MTSRNLKARPQAHSQCGSTADWKNEEKTDRFRHRDNLLSSKIESQTYGAEPVGRTSFPLDAFTSHVYLAQNQTRCILAVTFTSSAVAPR